MIRQVITCRETGTVQDILTCGPSQVQHWLDYYARKFPGFTFTARAEQATHSPSGVVWLAA